MNGFLKSALSLITKLPRQFGQKYSEYTGLRIVAIASITVASVVYGVRYLGILQPSELWAYDFMVRSTSDLETDPRFLIITITEGDIDNQKQWPISDQVLAQLLQKLQKYQPRVIGLDLYRNIPVPPGHQQLVTQLKKSNVIAIRNIDTLNGASSPAYLPPEQIGFNDVVIDPDSVIRRSVLFADSDSSVLYSFSLRLALAYLEKEGIFPQTSKINPQYLQLNKAIFEPLKRNSGGYQNIDAQGYQILLDYGSGREIAQQISLSKFLNSSIDPNTIKDKIVLIGTTAPSLNDNFYTPYSPSEKQNSKMPGVLIHAQMVSHFIDAATGKRSLFWFWSESQELIWIGLWILVAGSLAWRVRHPLVLMMTSSTALIILFGTCFYIFMHQGWIPLSSPALAFILTVGLVVTYRSYEDHQQQQIVMKLLGQNTSPEIAKALWQGRDSLLKAGKLPGKRLTATILFSDLKNFSTISEQRQPEELLEWLNELLDVITKEVLSRNGIINKFTGDGVMAAFGVPMTHIHKEDIAKDAQHAVECAMTISDAIEKLNQNWQSRGLPAIQMRVGIFTGPVVVGSLGGKDRMEYGIIGDTVNTASRLESCEKDRQPNHCRILIGHETFIHIQHLFVVESWGALPLKGKRQNVDVYLVKQRQQ